MSKKYIQNLTNGRVLITDNKGNMLVSLEPYQCSLTSFDEETLYICNNVSKMITAKWISLQDERTMIKLPEHKNYGQKYKIGTKCYLNDASKLELIIDSFNPNSGIYSAKVVKTGGLIKIQEKAISLTEPVEQNKKINVDIDEMGNFKEADEEPLPQAPTNDQDGVEIIRTDVSNEEKFAKNADDVFKSQEQTSREIANQQVEVIYTNPKTEKHVEDESTFIVKADKDVFAKEIKASELVENTQKVVAEEISNIAKSVKKDEGRAATIDETAFVELSEDMQEYIKTFMSKDSRVRKMTISRCKDIQKLTAIAKCADEVSKKGALAKLEKLNAK